MSKSHLRIGLVILLLGAGGGVLLISQRSGPANDQQPTPQATASAAPNTADAETAKTTVVKFILAVANPDQPNSSPEQRRAGLAYLSENLKARVSKEFGDDPGGLLTVRPAFFTVNQPKTSEGEATVAVAFYAQRDSRDAVTYSFRLGQDDNDRWLINAVETEE